MKQQLSSKDYQRFRIWLEHATTVDQFDYACFVHAHKYELSIGFHRSGETDSYVYGRMQYVRARDGVGL